MFRALITTIPFQRIPSLTNPEWNHLPRAILHDITQFINLERLFYPNKPSLYNTKPFIHIAKNTTYHSLESSTIAQHKPLNKYYNSYLIDTFARDLSVYNNPDNKILVSRHWIDYNQNYKLLQILSIREIFDYHIEFAAYMQYLHGTRYHPDFNARTHNHNHNEFLEQLQKLNII